MVLNGFRLGMYEPMRYHLTSAIYSNAQVQSLGINIFSGAASGVIGAAAGSPFFLVKTRLQSYSPFLPVGTQHKYHNAVDGLRTIYRGEGVSGLYRGVGAAMVRTGFGSSVQLPTYFFAKRRLVRHLGMEEGPALHLASSAVSGFAVCCVMHPPGNFPTRQSSLGPFELTLVSQTPSWRECITKPATFMEAYSTVCIKPSVQRVFSLYTRASSLILLVFSLTL